MSDIDRIKRELLELKKYKNECDGTLLLICDLLSREQQDFQCYRGFIKTKKFGDVAHVWVEWNSLIVELTAFMWCYDDEGFPDGFVRYSDWESFYLKREKIPSPDVSDLIVLILKTNHLDFEMARKKWEKK